MIKAIDKMHSRSKMVSVGPMCFGQQLVGAYRTMEDEESGKKFCMIMQWNGHGNQITYRIQESDEYMHLFFEDTRDWNREIYLRENGDISLEEEITESKEYQRVYAQLFRAVSKKMSDLGYKVAEDLSFTEE